MAKKHGTKQQAQSRDFEEFIKSRTHQDGECLIWDGAKTQTKHPVSTGYHQKVFGTSSVARMVYIWNYEASPKKPFAVRHTCDNNDCLNPNHLCIGEMGTPFVHVRQLPTEENSTPWGMQHIKNRQDHEIRVGRKVTFFTPQEQQNVRDLYAAGTKQTDLMKIFSCSNGPIRRALGKL